MFHDNSICTRYVNALRTKSTVYKEKRAELSELRAESGVLARTCEVSTEPFENASRVIIGNNNRLKRLLGWLLFHSGSKISGDEHPAKLGGSWEGERSVWLSWYHWEPGEGRWAEGDAEINLFFYCIGPRWKSWKLFLLLGQVGQSMTIKLNNNLLIIMNIILKAGLDERKGATLEEMSGLVHQLTLRIGERKARLAPIIKVLIF